MKWLPDPTGRFPQRPYFENDELDRECEGVVTAFLRATHGTVSYPLTTNDLTILIEREVASLDLYADLSAEGDDVEGMTTFPPRGKPSIAIQADLADPRREHRLRTTLTHELGHVRFHTFLWTFEATTSSLAPKRAVIPHPRCKREAIIDAKPVDWMEWQAGYTSGAFLMPISALRRVVRDARRHAGLGPSAEVSVTSPGGQELIRGVQVGFQVSADAARVRLLQLDIVSE